MAETNCPHCQQVMQPVNLVGHYGAKIIVDQCPKCGGIWFDSLEYAAAAPGQAATIDHVDAEKLRLSQRQHAQPLYCPRDGQLLTQFHDENFPRDIQVESCQHCYGFWFNVGEFQAFQAVQARQPQAEPRRLDPKLESQIDALLHDASGSSFATLGKLGQFLSTPVDHRGQPLTLPTDPRTEPAGQVANIALQTMNGLLRLLIR